MKTATDFAAELERLAEQHSAMMAGVRRDGLIDYEEAFLGKEYAEEYRARLQAMKREIQAVTKDVRAEHRAKMRDLRASYRTVPIGEANALLEAQLNRLQPYQEVVMMLDRVILDARLERDAFRAAVDALKYDPSKTIRLERAEADGDESLIESMLTDGGALVEELRDCVDRWRTLLDETERRLASNEYPSQGSHLRGVKKALELAISDVMIVLTMEATESKTGIRD